MNVRNTWLLLAITALAASPSCACSVLGKISGRTMFSQADVILRVKAERYASAPSRDARGMIQFRTLETIRGTASSELLLPGELVDADDWNDQPVPYDFVRRMGRGGSCFASFYREGGEFLLFLKKTKDGTLTTEWYPMGPVNEQLRSDNDAWLLWTREQQRKIQPK